MNASLELVLVFETNVAVSSKPRTFTQDADVKIGPMNREELDSVIRRPASLKMSDLKKVWQSAS
jgi:hypothetical protein